jgi:ligand-binding sensor domain-containing protein
LVEDNNGRIWYIKNSGIGFIDPSHGMRGFYRDTTDLFNNVQSMMKDARGRIWVPRGDKGVVVIDLQEDDL